MPGSCPFSASDFLRVGKVVLVNNLRTDDSCLVTPSASKYGFERSSNGRDQPASGVTHVGYFVGATSLAVMAGADDRKCISSSLPLPPHAGSLVHPRHLSSLLQSRRDVADHP